MATVVAPDRLRPVSAFAGAAGRGAGFAGGRGVEAGHHLQQCRLA